MPARSGAPIALPRPFRPPADSAPLTRERTSPRQFLREVRSELRKVAWPSRREVAVYTVTVLLVTAMLTLVVWGMDYVLRQAATQFL